jgi:hypothetical protein
VCRLHAAAEKGGRVVLGLSKTSLELPDALFGYKEHSKHCAPQRWCALTHRNMLLIRYLQVAAPLHLGFYLMTWSLYFVAPAVYRDQKCMGEQCRL